MVKRQTNSNTRKKTETNTINKSVRVLDIIYIEKLSDDQMKETILNAKSLNDAAESSVDGSHGSLTDMYKYSCSKTNLTSQKPYKYATNFKKHKKPKACKSMTKRIKKYMYENYTMCKNLKKDNSESLFEIVSTCQILKRVAGKENEVGELNFTENSINENKDDLTPSLHSAHSTISNYSQNTIIMELTETGNFDRRSENLVVNTPLNTTVINISRVQVNNTSFANIKSSETFTVEEDDSKGSETAITQNLDSTETFSHLSNQTMLFTSSEDSNDTLVSHDKNLSLYPEESICFYPSTSSFSRSSFTLENKLNNTSKKNYSKISVSHTKVLIDSFNDLGRFSDPVAPKSSTTFNEVIVAERLNTIVDISKEQKKLNTKYNQNNDLYNDYEAVMNNLRKTIQKSDSVTCTDELRWEKPCSIAELWEKLNQSLDAQVHKLQKSLTDTIAAETKLSLNILTRYMQFANAEKFTKPVDIKNLNKLDEDLQCNLLDGPKTPIVLRADVALSGIFTEQCVAKEVQYNLKPNVEILKPAVSKVGDSLYEITIDTEKPGPSVISSTNRLRPIFSTIQYFCKENAVVLAGAPIFLVIFVCLYFIIILIVNGM